MASGQVERLHVDQIPSQGRRTQGRSLVKLSSGDRVVEVTRAYGDAGQKERQSQEEREEVRNQLDLLG